MLDTILWKVAFSPIRYLGSESGQYAYDRINNDIAMGDGFYGIRELK
jgi:hypothetical protein